MSDRNDPHEGWQTLNIHSGDSSLVGVTMPEPKMYILCTSFVQSDQMAKKFKAESYFKIHDPFNFSITVAKAIPNCINGFQGACFYTESKETSSDLPYGSLFTEDPKSEKEITEKTESAIRQADNLNSVFNKPTTYSDQNEYRIIWFTSENTQETIKVNCKEAIRFCTLCQNP